MIIALFANDSSAYTSGNNLAPARESVSDEIHCLSIEREGICLLVINNLFDGRWLSRFLIGWKFTKFTWRRRGATASAIFIYCRLYHVFENIEASHPGWWAAEPPLGSNRWRWCSHKMRLNLGDNAVCLSLRTLNYICVKFRNSPRNSINRFSIS